MCGSTASVASEEHLITMTIDPIYESLDQKVKRFFVYMVRTSMGNLYTGISVDPERRCLEHNTSRKGARSLRGQRPVKLIWTLDIPLTQSSALKFEHKLKQLSHQDKERFLHGDLPIEIPK
jgi:putative endonuclease